MGAAASHAAVAAAIRKFGRLDNFVFVLDGDRRGDDTERRIRDAAGRDDVLVLFLPGRAAPGVWVWDMLRRNTPEAAAQLHIAAEDLAERIGRQDAIYATASGRPSEIAKARLSSLSEPLGCDVPDLCRVVGRLEVERADSAVQPLMEHLESALLRWRDAP